jgi:hypothetical protein
MSNKLGVNPSVVALGSVVVAFATGAGAGYFFAKKQFESISDQEIAEFKEEWNARQEAHFAALEMAAKNEREKGALPAMVDKLGYTSESEAPEPVSTTTTRVFDYAPRVPEWDQEAEEVTRRNNPIYVLSREEFFTNEHDFEELQYTYYEGDDVLCDNKDQMITDPAQQVGDEYQHKFGYGSEAEDVIYIQNEHKARVYEITRTDGKYSEVVLGLDNVDEEIRHSHKPKRFRSYHDV